MMAALRGMMLLLVTVFGYAAGVTSARRGAVPGLFDMGIVLSLWLLDLWMAPGIGHWQSVGLGLLAGATAGATRRLLAPGASAPRRPEAIELGWRAFMKEIGNYQGRLTLLFVYFVVVSPFALISRASSDPLRLRGSDPGSFWVDRASGDTTISAAKRQF